MKRKIVLRLSMLTVLLTFLWSCRNEDFLQSDKNPLRNNSEFFTHAKNGGANARSGVDYIDILEVYNREKDFLVQMPDQKGMPIWEKMQIVDAEGATGLMIPLSHDDETMSSVLFATIDEKNSVIGVRDYDNSLLEKIVYDEKIDQKFREQMFYTFMYVDNKTFGTEEFTHIPKDLFEGTKRRNEEYGRMKFTDFTPSPKVSLQQNGKVLLIENCAVTWHCTHHGGGGPCDYCSECYGMVCSTTMISVADDPFPGTPGSGSSGGGGLPPSGPEGNIPSDDPCGASTSVFYRLAPGCSGSGNPDLPEVFDDSPCGKIKSQFTKTKYKNKVATIDKVSVFNLKHESGFSEDTAGDFTDLPVSTSTDNSDNMSLTYGATTLGYTHTHLNDVMLDTHNEDGEQEMLIKIRMFSPPDVDALMGMADYNKSPENFGDLYGTMLSKDGTYVIKFTGTAADIKMGFNTQAWIDQYEIYFKKNKDRRNETNFLLFMRDEMQVNGISLYQVKPNGKVFEIKLNAEGTKAESTECGI